MVHQGPVLDIPIGTGRYLPIYQEKGIKAIGIDTSSDMIAEALNRDPQLDHKVGSITSIPMADQSVHTAVCTRLVNWFHPISMATAVGELLRVAQDVVLSIRLADEGEQRAATYTHSRDDLLDALEGAWIYEERLLLDEGVAGKYYALGIRRPTHQDVIDQFRWNPPGSDPQTLTDEWCDRYEVNRFALGDTEVRCEYWTGERLGREVDKMAELEPRLLPSGSPSVEKPPRKDGLPITILDFGDGRLGQVDGRHRVNLWRKQPTKRYPVFICSLY